MDKSTMTILLQLPTVVLLILASGIGGSKGVSLADKCPTNWWYMSTGHCLYVSESSKDFDTARQQCLDCGAELLVKRTFEGLMDCISNLGLQESYWLGNMYMSGMKAVWNAKAGLYEDRYPESSHRFLCLMQQGDNKSNHLPDVRNDSQCPLTESNGENSLQSTMAPEQAYSLMCPSHCPTSLRVTAEEADYLTLTWNAGWELGSRRWFGVMYTTGNDTWENVSEPVQGTAVNMIGLEGDRTYTFKVVPYYGVHTDRCTNNLMQFRTGPPECPVYVKVTSSGADYISLEWQPGKSGGSIQSFQLYYSTSNIGNIQWQKYDKVVQQAELEMTGLTPHTSYSLRVVAFNKYSDMDTVNAETCGGSGMLIGGTATPKCPQGIRVTKNGVDYITLSWQPVAPGGLETRYEIFYSAEGVGSSWRNVGAVTRDTSVKVDGLMENTVYKFKVASLDTFRDFHKVNEATCDNTIRSRTVQATPTFLCPRVKEERVGPTTLICEIRTFSLGQYTSVSFRRGNETSNIATCNYYTCESSQGYIASVETMSGEITATLEIEEIAMVDAGGWECSYLFGENDRRTSQCELDVFGPPDCPTNIQATNHSADHIVLSWLPGTPRADVQLFHVYVATGAEMTDWKLYEGDLTQTSLTVYELRGNTVYSFRVASSNIHSSIGGISENACNNTINFKTEEPRTNYWFAMLYITEMVAGGLGLFLLLVITILLTFLCRCHRTRSVKMSKDKTLAWKRQDSEDGYATVKDNENPYNIIPSNIPAFSTRPNESHSQNAGGFLTNEGYWEPGANKDLVSKLGLLVSMGKTEYITPLDYPLYGKMATTWQAKSKLASETKDGNISSTGTNDHCSKTTSLTMPGKNIECLEDGYLRPSDILENSDKDKLTNNQNRELTNQMKDRYVSPKHVNSGNNCNSSPASPDFTPLKDVNSDVMSSNTELKNVVGQTGDVNTEGNSTAVTVEKTLVKTGSNSNKNDYSRLETILDSTKNIYTSTKASFEQTKTDATHPKRGLSSSENNNTDVKSATVTSEEDLTLAKSLLDAPEDSRFHPKDALNVDEKAKLSHANEVTELDNTSSKHGNASKNDKNILKNADGSSDDANTRPNLTMSCGMDGKPKTIDIGKAASENGNGTPSPPRSPEYGFFWPGDLDPYHHYDRPRVMCFTQLEGLAELSNDTCMDSKHDSHGNVKGNANYKQALPDFNKPIMVSKTPKAGKYANRKLPAVGVYGQ